MTRYFTIADGVSHPPSAGPIIERRIDRPSSAPHLPTIGVSTAAIQELYGPLREPAKSRIAIVGCCIKEHFPFAAARANFDRACVAISEAADARSFEFLHAPEPFEQSAELIRYCDRVLADGLAGIVFVHAAYAPGELGSHFGRWLSDHRVPVLSWSFPDVRGGRLLANSLCCQNFLLNMWRRLGVTYAWLHESLEATAAKSTIRRFARTIRARDRFRQGRALHVGGSRVSGFYDGEADELAVMRRFGIQFDRIDLEAVATRARLIADRDVQKVRDALLGDPRCAGVDVPDEQVNQTLRFGLAVYIMALEQDYLGCTFKSWPEMFSCYKCAIDGAVSVLNDAGLCTVEEGDMNGLLSSLAMHLLTDGAASPTMMDLSVVDRRENRIGIWHCGASPTRALKTGSTFAVRRHSILENADPAGAVGMMVEFLLELGAATVLRYQSPDAATAFRFEGELVETDMAFRGAYCEMEPNEPFTATQLIGTILSHGMDHHWSLGYGRLGHDLDMLNHWLGVQTLAPLPDTGTSGLSA